MTHTIHDDVVDAFINGKPIKSIANAFDLTYKEVVAILYAAELI